MSEKNLKIYWYLFVFDRVHECNGQTDRHCMTTQAAFAHCVAKMEWAYSIMGMGPTQVGYRNRNECLLASTA